MVKKFFLITLILCCTFPLAAQHGEVTVRAFTDSTDYLIGDRIKYTVQVVSPENTQIIASGFRDSIANVDVISIDAPKIETTDNGKITTYVYTVSKFDSAEITIPTIPFYYKTGKNSENGKIPYFTPEQAAADPSVKTALSNPVSFSVHLVKVNTQEDIKDVKDPVKLPLDWKIVALLFLAALIIIGLLYFLYRKYKAKKEGLPQRHVIAVPPHIAALNSLKELEQKKLWQDGKVKEYHSEITEIIRKYFEERFKLPALELTTSEVMLHLRNLPYTEANRITDITYNFLSNADLVKFAKYTPMNIINEEMMKQAYEIVNLTAAPVQPKITEESNVQ